MFGPGLCDTDHRTVSQHSARKPTNSRPRRKAALDRIAQPPHIAVTAENLTFAKALAAGDTVLTPESGFTWGGGGPRGVGGPALKLPGSIKLLLGAMLLGHLAQAFLPFEQRHWLEITFALWMFAGGELLPERAYSLLTYAFLHGDWWHLIFNALWIAILGSKLHEVLGTGRFLVLFAISTAFAGVVQVASGWGETTLTIGASGFVYALVACIAYLYVLQPTDSPAERRKKLVVFSLAIAFVNVAFAYVAGGFVTAGGIAWQAHAGGYLAGLVLFPPLARSALKARHGARG